MCEWKSTYGVQMDYPRLLNDLKYNEESNGVCNKYIGLTIITRHFATQEIEDGTSQQKGKTRQIGAIGEQ